MNILTLFDRSCRDLSIIALSRLNRYDYVSIIYELGRKGKERKGIYVLMEKKIPFVGLETTPSAVRADVPIQLD